MKYCSKKDGRLDIHVFTGSDALPLQWDDLLPAGHFLKKEQLQVTEDSGLPDISYLYVMLSENSKAVAAAYFQVLRLRPEHINSNTVNTYRYGAWKWFTHVARPKLLVAGHLFRHDVSSFYITEGIPDFEAYQHYREAIDTALEHSCAMAVLVKDTATKFITYFQHFASGYLFLRNDISMEMDIPAAWNSIADYERALKHKYAQRMRKIRGAWNQLTVKELSVEEVHSNKEVLYRLYRQVSGNQQVRLGYLGPDFMVRLKTYYGNQLRVWGIYEQEKMIAFYSAWVKEDVFDMFYIGFDYSRNAELQLYFNILFFSVEQAINLRKNKLILGRTALDAKARLGCRPRYLSTFLYVRNAFIRNRVLKAQNDNTSQEGDWEQRHPFK